VIWRLLGVVGGAVMAAGVVVSVGAAGEEGVAELLARSLRELDAGHLDVALTSVREALRVAPENPTAHNNAGVIFDRAGHHDVAARELKVAVQLRPDYEEAHYNLAHVYLELARQLQIDEEVE